MNNLIQKRDKSGYGFSEDDRKDKTHCGLALVPPMRPQYSRLRQLNLWVFDNLSTQLFKAFHNPIELIKISYL